MTRRPTFLRLSTIMLAAGLSASAAMAQEATTLAYKWTKGTRTYYKWTEQVKTKISGAPGGDMEGMQSRISWVAFEVKDVAADGLATVQATYEGIAIDSQAPRQPVQSYDSTKSGDVDSSSTLAQVFSAFIGESFTFTVDSRGEVKKVEGVKKIIEDVAAANVNNPSSTIVINTLKDNVTDDSMSVNLRRVLTSLPEKAVKPGETWRDSIDLPIPRLGTMKADRLFTFKRIDKIDAGNAALIAGDYTITLTQPKEGDPAAAMFSIVHPTMKDGNGTSERVLILDSGLLEKSTVNAAGTIEMDVPGGGADRAKNALTFTYILEHIEKPPARPPVIIKTQAAPVKNPGKIPELGAAPKNPAPTPTDKKK